MSTIASTANTHTTSLVATSISPPKKKPKYELGVQIGTSLISTVHKAIAVADGTVVAIKRNKDKSQFRSLTREAHILIALEAMKARHIVRLLDYYVETPNKVYALVLEYIVLLDLDQMICNRVVIDLNQTITIAYQALEYLADLQSKNIIHTDIKPENMFFDRPSNYLRIFDYSNSIRIGKDRFDKHIQTPKYRSPEAALEKDYDCSADIWSLACSIYELYTGNPLFPVEAAADQVAISHKLLHLIAQQCGMPSEEYLRDSPYFDEWYEESNGKVSFKMSTSQTIIKGFDFRDKMRECGKARNDPPETVGQLIELLGSMLVYENRPSPFQLFQSPIFTNETCFTIELTGSKPALGDLLEIAHPQTSLKPIFSTPLLPSVMQQCFHLSLGMPSGKYYASINRNSWNEVVIKNRGRTTIHLTEKKEEKNTNSQKVKQEEK